MERIRGLAEYVKNKEYREALGLPKEKMENYELLAQGEYNINYAFTHPVTGKKLLFRVNCGSQMHLEHQIEYEAHALRLMEGSGRTPKVLYVDGSKKILEHGVLVMEYLPGHAMDYHTELMLAALCLADIHSVPIPESEEILIHPQNPLKAILEECEEMFKVYLESPLGDGEKKTYIRELLDLGWKREAEIQLESGYQCCINTELNSTNLLINGEGKSNYLIDWKTDVILTSEEMEKFIDAYIKAVGNRFKTDMIREHTHAFIPITCLRGITWCAMAWVQYQQPDKLIFNESTFKKLNAYLDMDFLKNIRGYLEP